MSTCALFFRHWFTPGVEDILQVDMGQPRRGHCPLWRSYRRLQPLPFFRHPRLQPFLHPTDEAPVRYPLLDELHHPFVVDVVQGNHHTLPTLSTSPNG